MESSDVSQQKMLDTMQLLNMSRKIGELSDVVIIMDDSNKCVRIPAHRCVLAANSPYFHKMFTGNLAEAQKSEVRMEVTHPEALVALVDFIYTGKLSVSPENVEGLLTIASLIQLDDATSMCTDFLAKQLEPTNCLEIRRFADAHSFMRLVEAADNYSYQHFEDVVLGEEFLGLEVDHLIQLLSSDELGVDTEETVYKAAISWLNHKLEVRREHTALVVEKIRFCLLSTEFLEDTASQEPLIAQNKHGRLLVEHAKDYHSIPDQRLADDPQAKPRNSQNSLTVVLAVGGMDETMTDHKWLVERYDVRTKEWTAMAPMYEAKQGSAVLVHGSMAYIVGGDHHDQGAVGFERYDLVKKDHYVKRLPPICRRSAHGVVIFNGFLYILGGCSVKSSQRRILDTLLRVDLCTYQVLSLASMKFKNRLMGCIVLNGQIFSCGGITGVSEERRVLNTVELYDPKTDSWISLPSMWKSRYAFNCITFLGSLYVVGGGDEECRAMAACERYDLKSESWIQIADMKHARYRAGLAVFDELIYAVGGNDEKFQMLRSAEAYNPSLDLWTECPTNEQPDLIRSWVSFSTAV